MAVDGSRSGNYRDFSCTHTPTEDNPFWYVSFEPFKVNISVIRITNRQDCCQDRLSNFEIRIGDYFGEDAEKSPKCGDLHTISGDSKVISCRGMVGRFVTIRIPGKRKILTLCEVEVFGTRKYLQMNVAAARGHQDAESHAEVGLGGPFLGGLNLLGHQDNIWASSCSASSLRM